MQPLPKHVTTEERVWIEIAFALRSKARTTQRDYERDLRRFLRWGGGYLPLSDDGARFLLSTTHHTIELYHEWLKKQPGTRPRDARAGALYVMPCLAHSSIERYIVSLARTFQRLVRTGLMDKNPVNLGDLELTSGKKDRKRPTEYISDVDVIKIFNAIEREPNSIVRQRDRAFLEILFGGGLRLKEVVNLKVGNFTQKITPDGALNGVWIVSPKGKIDRFQPLPAHSIEAIQAYLTTRRVYVDIKPETPLIGSRGGLKGGLTENALYLRFKKLTEHAGLVNVSPHSARRTAISNIYYESKDLRIAQIFAGHKSIATTQEYLQTDATDIAKVLSRMSR